MGELKDIKYEDNKLNFVHVYQGREGQSRTSKFKGTIQDANLSGILSGDRGEYKLEGNRSKRTPKAIGNWEMNFKIGLQSNIQMEHSVNMFI